MNAFGQETLDGARLGAEWAWTSIYRGFSPAILGFMRAKGAHDPEGLTGEVFLQVVRDLGRFSGGIAEFKAWVFTIARNRFLDDRRASSRRPTTPRSDDFLEAHGEIGDVEEEALRALGTERVKELVSRLSPDQQDVLLLRIVADMSLEEVARVLGKRTGAVKALQHRALAALRRHIDQLEDGLTIIDGNAERKVDAGFIDILAQDRQAVDQPGRQPDPADGAGLLVLHQPQPGQVAAGDALYLDHLQALAAHGASGPLEWHVRAGDHVMGRDIGQLVEPPQRQLGQDLPLARDRGR
jgi:RNA polymerase sigma factor (sigma-70 family)